MRVLSLVSVSSAILAGCAPQTVDVPVPIIDRTPCVIMSAHMPQRVQRADTYVTKVDALHRNEAWSQACPAPSDPHKKP